MNIPDWLTLSTLSGSGNTTITVTASSNAGDTRVADFQVSGNTKTDSFSVVQEAAGGQYESQYLTIRILTGTRLALKVNRMSEESGTYSKRIYYSKNNGSWTTLNLPSIGSSTMITVSPGDEVRLKGENNSYSTANAYFEIGMSSSYTGLTFNVYGNILSLVYGDNFANYTELPSGSSNNFKFLFSTAYYLGSANTQYDTSMSAVVHAENLVLPQNTTDGCYDSMFYGSQTLRTAPVLPATDVSANHCYASMFIRTSITYLKCLASTGWKKWNTTAFWMADVPNYGTFVKNPSATFWEVGGYNGIPSGWTIEDNAQTRLRKSPGNQIPVAISETQYLNNNSTDWIIG